ncbi:MAG: hypothetical protein WA418_40065 [Bradyrhizobium sp.]
MRLLCVLIASLLSAPAFAQNRPATSPSAAAQPSAIGDSIAGKWTYRSFINTPRLVGDDANLALALIFGEGVFTFELPTSTTLKGNLDMGSGFVLDLEGTVRPPAPGAPLTVEIVGTGRANSPTAGWEYDYHGYLAYRWPNGVSQVPALVGSVIRAKPHNGAPAGVTASFIAVKQP